MGDVSVVQQPLAVLLAIWFADDLIEQLTSIPLLSIEATGLYGLKVKSKNGIFGCRIFMWVFGVALTQQFRLA